MPDKNIAIVPTIVTITNKGTEEYKFQFYKVNQYFTIHPGDTLKVLVNDSDELGNYKSLSSLEISVETSEQNPVTSEESVEPPVPTKRSRKTTGTTVKENPEPVNDNTESTEPVGDTTEETPSKEEE